jgi:hypothetical protein
MQPPCGFSGIVFFRPPMPPIAFVYLFLRMNDTFGHILHHHSRTGSGLADRES